MLTDRSFRLVVVSVVVIGITTIVGPVLLLGGLLGLRADVQEVRYSSRTAVALEVGSRLWWLGSRLPRLAPLDWVPWFRDAGAVLRASSDITRTAARLYSGPFREAVSISEGGLFDGPGRLRREAILGIERMGLQIEALLPRMEAHVDIVDKSFGPVWSLESRSGVVRELRRSLRVAQEFVQVARDIDELAYGSSPSHIFLGVTNPAELRGVQGIIGQYAVLRLDSGRLFVEEVGSNIDLEDPARIPDALPSDVREVFGDGHPEWVNMTVSPRVEDAGIQIRESWFSQRGQRLGMVGLVDIVALARLIEISGGVEAVTPSGHRLEGGRQLADYLMNGIYFDFPIDNLERKRFQTELARLMIERALAEPPGVVELARFGFGALSDRRIRVWVPSSADPSSSLMDGGRIDSTPQPHDLQVVFNNWSGNKLDFYLTVGTDITSNCDGSRASHRVTLEIRNDAPIDTELPDYLTRRLDSDDPADVPSSSIEIFVWLGSALLPEAFLHDGYPVDYSPDDRLGRGGFVRLALEVPATSAATLELALSSKRCRTLGIEVGPLSSDRNPG